MSESSSARGTSGSSGARDVSAVDRSGAVPRDVAEGLGQLIERHLGSVGPGLELFGPTYPAWHWADVDAALDGLDEDQAVCGVGPGCLGSLAELLADRSEECRPGSVQRSAFPVGPDEVRWVATNALRLVRVGGDPVVVFAYGTHGAAAHGSASRGGVSDGGAAHHNVSRGEPGVRVEVLAADPAAARSVLAAIDAAVVADSSLRGRVVSFRAPHSVSSSHPSAEAFPQPRSAAVPQPRSAAVLQPNPPANTQPNPAIDFHERPGLVADDVVLPTGHLARVEATVLGISRNAAGLRAAGQHLPRAVLLHGPPDSGKTHTVQYLLSQSPDTTVFILPGAVLRDMRAGGLQRGRSAGFIRQVLATARQLTPAIVVLEDVDLVAADHGICGDHHADDCQRPGLAEVLDALDEMVDDEDVDLTVILTTHRIEAIEQALALRPGLIDLALEVPLPDADLRERLFARSARALPVTSAGVRTAAEAAVATPGSFPRQVVRRAVLDALSADAEVDDARLVSAVRALMAERAELRTATSRKTARDHWSSVKGAVGSEPGAAGPGLRESSEHSDGSWAEGSAAEVRGAGDVLAVLRAREGRRDSFGAEGAFGVSGRHGDGPGGGGGLDGDHGLGEGAGVGDDGLGGSGGVGGHSFGGGDGFEDDGLDGGDGLDRGGHDVEVIDDLDDGLSGEDLLDLDLDDED